jgi:hypothetical protein
MDPYIESLHLHLWEDFHDSLVNEIKNALFSVLPDRYVVRAGERSYIVLEPRDIRDEERHDAQADVTVLVSRTDLAEVSPSHATAVLEAVTTEPLPVELMAMVEVEYRQAFLEISALAPGRKLITTIELLSPSNKRFNSPGWDLYLRKRQAHLSGQANLVEIDLLRGGRRMPMSGEWPDCPYYLLVGRKERAPRCTVWPAHFVRPLPVIPIPLAPPDPDIPLQIQPLVNQIYERSRYARDIDYRKPCRPRLSDAETKWLDDQL